jgi:hypothetical protein
MVKALEDAKQALAAYKIDDKNQKTAPRTATVRAHLTTIGSATAKLTKALKAMDLRTAELLKKAAGATEADPLVDGHRRVRALQIQLNDLNRWINEAAGATAADPFVEGHRRVRALQSQLDDLNRWIGTVSANTPRSDRRPPAYPGLNAFVERLAAIWRNSEPAFIGSRKYLAEVKFIRAILKAGGFDVTQAGALKAVQRVVSSARRSQIASQKRKVV